MIFGVGAFANLRPHYKRKSIENIDAQTRLVYWGYHSFDGDPYRSKRSGESHDLKGSKQIPRKNDFFSTTSPQRLKKLVDLGGDFKSFLVYNPGVVA